MWGAGGGSEVGKLVTYKGIDRIGKYTKDEGSQTFTSEKGNEPCAVQLEFEVSVCMRGFQYERER